jgi:superfamily II DNA or RNA helicase
VRLAAFQNPEFYRKQSMRLSTALTARVICCAEGFPAYIALPRGCTDHAAALLESLGMKLEIDDQREVGRAIELEFHGTLTTLQETAARALMRHDVGVLVAPPGIGKTVAGIFIMAERARSTLVLVHRQPLLDQWITQLSLFLNVEEKSIGRVGGGKRRLTGQIDVAMIQSLLRDHEVDDLVAEYGQVIVDECHHVPARQFERVLSEVKARYVIGLTATPKRRDGHHPILEMQLGPARYVVDSRSKSTARTFRHRLVVCETDFELPDANAGQSIQRLYRSLAGDERRNDLILNDVISALEEGRSPIVLTERRDHLDFLEARLRGFTPHLIVLRGGASVKKRREALDELASVPKSAERLVLATGRYIGEGFDDARLDTLFLTMPVSWRGTVVQYSGRLHRSHPGKSEVRIYDYVDGRVPVLARMFQKRVAGYRSMGYEPDEAIG